MSLKQNSQTSASTQPGVLAQPIIETRAWIDRLGGMAQALAASVSKWNAPNRESDVRGVGRQFLELVSSESRGSRRWSPLLLLEAPAVRRAARVYMVEKISERGIYRDISDLPDVSALAIGCVVAASLLQSESDVARIAEFVGNCPTRRQYGSLAPGDATFLGLILKWDELEALHRIVPRLIDNTELEDTLRLACWICALDTGQTERVTGDQLPSSLSQAWFENRAFRGPRRHWARKYGIAAGIAGTTSLPGWLLPYTQSGVLAEGYGAMLVEWTLAAVRHLPDRNHLLNDNPDELGDRARAIRREAQQILERCEQGSELAEWLKSSLRDLTTSAFSERRLTRNTNPSQRRFTAP